LIGHHFADIRCLVEHYLPKPALDHITSRMTDLLKRRPDAFLANDPARPESVPADGAQIEEGGASQ
jgi:hypothetical protein